MWFCVLALTILTGGGLAAPGPAGAQPQTSQTPKPQPQKTQPQKTQPLADPLVRARQLYNAGDFDAALAAAAEAAKRPEHAVSAALVQGRAHLERYRRSTDASDLAAGRDRLSALDATKLTPRDRLELAVGLAQALFLEDQFGAAAELFATAAGDVMSADPEGYDRVIDWWAASLDRYATARPAADRARIYAPLIERLEREQRERPSTSGIYWLPAMVRGSGDVDRAWNLAIAGWVRAPLTGTRAASLRNDLDQLVTQGIIPERVRRGASLAPRGTAPTMTADSLNMEWTEIKSRWK